MSVASSAIAAMADINATARMPPRRMSDATQWLETLPLGRLQELLRADKNLTLLLHSNHCTACVRQNKNTVN